jgi:type IV pilus assembly protein PilN
MIRINLLPVRQIKQRNRARQEVIVLLTGFLLLLSAIGLVAYRQASRISELQVEAAQLQKETDEFQAVVALIAKIKKEQKVLEDKMKVIKDLKSASQLSPRVLDEIASLTPADRMWLTSLDYTNNLIMLSGTALDNATIAEYMNRVGASDFFLAAELKNSSLIKVGNQKLKSFSMTVTVLASLIPESAPVAPAAAKK